MQSSGYGFPFHAPYRIEERARALTCTCTDRKKRETMAAMHWVKTGQLYSEMNVSACKQKISAHDPHFCTMGPCARAYRPVGDSMPAEAYPEAFGEG